MINPLVSIIMPVFNGEEYIAEAIDSVLAQTHNKCELIIINDGSIDNTKNIIFEYGDVRIKYHEQNNTGVSAARNVGLINMKGDYFCFLDADDILVPSSIFSRLVIFSKNPDVSFVDGCVQFVDSELNNLSSLYKPNFKGTPFNKLLMLSSDCFFGPTWMIKRDYSLEYEFDTSLTHSEDLYFYLTISKNKIYSYTNDIILLYRQSSNSAMKNIIGLESSYIKLAKNIRNRLKIKGWKLFYLKLKISKIMILSFAFDSSDIKSAIKSPFKILMA